MRVVKLSENTKHPSKEILNQVIGSAIQQGMNIAQMRRRMKILDALEVANGELVLEDADWDMVKSVYEAHPFAIVHQDLISVADAIENAERK